MKKVKLNLIFNPELLKVISSLQERINSYQFKQNGTLQEKKKKNRRKMKKHGETI